MKIEFGFSLIELMVVIAIISVSMAYAVPAYQRYVIMSKRTEAQNAIMQIAAAQEQNNATYHQYALLMSNTSPSNTDLGLANAVFLTSQNYNYSISAINGFTITATAKGLTQINDIFTVNCTVLTLNSLGVKTPLSCWQ